MNQKVWEEYIEKAGETGLTNIIVSQNGNMYCKAIEYHQKYTAMS